MWPTYSFCFSYYVFIFYECDQHSLFREWQEMNKDKLILMCHNFGNFSHSTSQARDQGTPQVLGLGITRYLAIQYYHYNIPQEEISRYIIVSVFWYTPARYPIKSMWSHRCYFHSSWYCHFIGYCGTFGPICLGCGAKKGQIYYL